MSLEISVSKFWTREQVATTVERTAQCWFDYRMIHPAMRALYFAEQYARARERAFKHHYGRNKPCTPINIYSTRALSKGATAMFINTMHIVDQMQMPYGAFFDAVIESLLQEHGYATTWDNTGWGDAADGVPLLGHMRHGSAIMAAQKEYDETCRIRLPRPAHPAFKMRNWAGTQVQRECVNWFCAQVRRRPHIERPHVIKRMIEDDYLNEREVLRKFGADMVREIRAIV